MKLGVYAVRDVRTSFVGQLMTDLTESSAVRNFEHAILATKDIMNSHPDDFSLYYVGDYDNLTGIIEALPVPVLVISGSDIVNKQNNK